MKKIWKWVIASAAFIVGVVALVTSQSKGKKVYDKKVKDNNDKIKEVKTKTNKATAEKAAAKADLSKSKEKTASIKSQVKHTGSAKKTTKNFKKKYRGKK